MTITSIQGESLERAEPVDPADPPDAELTARGQAILQFIAEHIAAHGYPPSVREVGDRVGLASTSSVHYQLRRLERCGFLVRGPRKSRALTVVPAPAADSGEEAA